MFDNIGICKGPGTVLGQIKIGSTEIQLSKIGKGLYFLIDKRAVLSAKNEKDLIVSSIPVVSHIVKNLLKISNENTLKWKLYDAKYTKLMEDALKTVSENVKPAGAFVLELKPDEISDNSVINASTNKDLSAELENYSASFKRIAETVESVKHGTDILLRTSLDKNMWGSKEVMTVINGIKSDLTACTESYETFEGCFEHVDSQTRFIQAAIRSKASLVQAKGVIARVIEDFSFVKSYLSSFVKASQKLYTIDNVFKTRVGYPATWFFNGSIYMDYLLDHDIMVDHLIKTASLESRVIEPLLAWKIKLAGA